jgi:hypothetical protein
VRIWKAGCRARQSGVDRLYGQIDGRESFDNDVLAHKVDAPKAREAVASVGYEPVDGRTIERQLEVDYQYRMVRRVGAAGLASAELHWNAFRPDLYPVTEKVLWTHSEAFDLGGKRVRVFDEPLTLLHLAAHFAQHLFAEQSMFRDVAVAWNLWGATVDREELLALARATELVAVLDFALGAAANLGMLVLPAPEPRSRRAAHLLATG